MNTFLEKKGGRITLSTCADSDGKERLCIAVNSRQGDSKSYITPFKDAKTGTYFVIPKGY